MSTELRVFSNGVDTVAATDLADVVAVVEDLYDYGDGHARLTEDA